jgi:putative ABC transport system substrate-binding protein
MSRAAAVAIALAAILLTACTPATTPKPPTLIGVIQGISPDLAKPRVDALRAGLKALGREDGRDHTFDIRYLEGQGEDRAADLTRELVAKGAAIIVTGNPNGVAGAKKASATIPIVMSGVSPDPVADGFVQSLARPGGNVTGISPQVPTLPSRRLQMLRDVVPDVTRIGVLHDSTAGTGVLAALEQAASTTGLALQITPISTTSEIDGAFSAWRRVGIRAAHVNTAAVVGTNFAPIAAAALSNGIATSFGVVVR